MSLMHCGGSAAVPVASSPALYFSDLETSAAAAMSMSATLPEEEEKSDVLGKRSRDPDSVASDALQPSTAKRIARPHDVLFRIVVPSRQIGSVIGKEGSRIQRIREETKATIKIADPVAQYEERVIIISSRDDESEISNAESALYSIARVILEENNNGVEASKIGAAHVAANTIRLLISGSQAGCLIGISGQNIAQIRSSSGATVSILAPHQLPLCASAHESDRVVQVSGDVMEVTRALEKIGMKLRENPPKKVVSVRPEYSYGTVSSDQSHVPPSSAEHVTYEMMIMEKLVGGLIGRSGHNISKIRHESGATIKVTGLRGESSQRQIHIGGTAQQVAVARMLVENYICSQLLQQSGLQQF